MVCIVSYFGILMYCQNIRFCCFTCFGLLQSHIWIISITSRRLHYFRTKKKHNLEVDKGSYSRMLGTGYSNCLWTYYPCKIKVAIIKFRRPSGSFIKIIYVIPFKNVFIYLFRKLREIFLVLISLVCKCNYFNVQILSLSVNNLREELVRLTE